MLLQTLCWGTEQNLMNKNLQVYDDLSKKKSWHSSGQIPSSGWGNWGWEKHSSPLLMANQLIPSPVRGRELFLSYGTFGPKLHMGLSEDGLDSPLRPASPAEPDAWLGHIDTVLLVLWNLGCRGNSPALWLLAMCATQHLWAGLTGPAISFMCECGSI